MIRILAVSLVAALALPAAADPAAKPAPARLAIDVTPQGFAPDKLAVHAKEPVTLVFTRKTEQTCAKRVVIQVDDHTKIERDLPLDKPVEVAVTFPRAGTLGYACAMNMTKGVIVVQ